MRVLFSKFTRFKKLVNICILFLFLPVYQSYSQQSIRLTNSSDIIQLIRIVLSEQLALQPFVAQLPGSSVLNPEQVAAVENALAVVSQGMATLVTKVEQASDNQQDAAIVVAQVGRDASNANQVLIDMNQALIGGDPTNLQWLALALQSQSLLELVKDVDEAQQVFAINLGFVNDNQMVPPKRKQTKFSIPGGYAGAGGFDLVAAIEPGSDSADAGLTAVLDASIEVTDSLLGARKRTFKAMRTFNKNKKLFHKMIMLHKKNMKVKQVKKTKIITVPGKYTLNMDLFGGVIINADRVTVDLDGHKISSEVYPAIIVAEGKKDVKIKNGVVCGTQNAVGDSIGILVQKGGKSILVENIQFVTCKKGIYFDGQDTLPIDSCQVKNCVFTSNEKAVSLNHAKKIGFYDCDISDCFYKKIELNDHNEDEFETVMA